MDSRRMDERDKNDDLCIANFRMAPGLAGMVIRCASLDVLGLHPRPSTNTNERLITSCTGLILDLRSPRECNKELAQKWLTMHQRKAGNNGHGWQVRELDMHSFEHSPNVWQQELAELLFNQYHSKHQHRLVVRINVLPPQRFKQFMLEHWFTKHEQEQAATWRQNTDEQSKSNLRNLYHRALHEHGLLGLNQAILTVGKSGLSAALMAMTLHLERVIAEPKGFNVYPLIAIHCVQGKDRTGMLVMLCQSLLGVTDKVIIDDYHQSHNLEKHQNSDQNLALMHGAPRQVMVDTLQWLRHNYGSVCPGYLNAIGLDETYQARFRNAMLRLESNPPPMICRSDDQDGASCSRL